MGSDDRQRRRLFRLPFGEGRRRAEAEEEIRFHLEAKAARLEAEGMSPEDARREARRRFGNVDEVAREVEETMEKSDRAIRQTDVIDGARRDLAFSARQLGRNPGFSLIAILMVPVLHRILHRLHVDREHLDEERGDGGN